MHLLQMVMPNVRQSQLNLRHHKKAQMIIFPVIWPRAHTRLPPDILQTDSYPAIATSVTGATALESFHLPRTLFPAFPLPCLTDSPLAPQAVMHLNH